MKRVPGIILTLAGMAAVLDLLTLHGVRSATVGEDRDLAVQRFVIDSTRIAPRSDDGLLNWNIVDPALEQAPGDYPIRRVRGSTE